MIYFNNIPDDHFSDAILSNWLKALAVSYGVKINILHYNFVSESILLQINQDYLKHDTHTDIITFSYCVTPAVESEIFISIDRMRENAISHHETIDNEMLRLLAHGFLHSIGYKDANNEEKSRMTAEENRCIKMFHVKQEKDV
jgi:rRNA maturation RNase YbeY